MDKILIVGSGASGVHFALTVLKKGYEVLMLDVGYEKPEVVNPEDSFDALKTNLSDPVEYFLGRDYEAVIYPGFGSEYYGFPPSKNYVFSELSKFKYRANGFEPLFSFAQGGLAEAWTGGVYPFNDYELRDFPFSYKDIEPYYDEVANRIGITGEKDDLARFFPYHANLMEPPDLDLHSQLLLAEYAEQKDYLNSKLRCYLGRSRIATLSRDKDERKACSQRGRCLWGCPANSLYTPSITLNQCRNYPNFEYIPNMCVSHFKLNSKRQITHVVAESVNGKESSEFAVDKLVLAAGALSSSKIFMDSIFRNSGEIVKLHGLMDNRQILIPFINLKMIGETYNPESYQYHQVAMGIEREHPEEYIHGQITTLKTALVHPIIQSIPLDFKTSIFMFRNLHAALGVVNANLYDNRREDNYVTLELNKGMRDFVTNSSRGMGDFPHSSHSELVINYSPRSDEESLIKQSIKKTKKALRSLGCIIPPGMMHIRPMGASVHYAGTIPMSTRKDTFTSSEYCQSHDFDNLYIVDGATFPFLPAKNITFTLMANAIRVAENVF